MQAPDAQNESIDAREVAGGEVDGDVDEVSGAVLTVGDPETEEVREEDHYGS